MKYNFDKPTDRRGINSLKWNVAPHELPMWVADMDFEVCPHIVEAMKVRLEKPTFGYNIIPDQWYDAYINWWKTRHGFEIQRDWLMFSIGVVPSISSIVRRLTLAAENVVLQTPVYNMFFNSIVNNGRNVLESPLVYKEGKYSVDFDDLEEKLANPQTSLMILCNPHNPVGKIWDRATLQKIGELCFKHNVVVLSDEIHCDFTLPNNGYTPFASVSEVCKNNSITCISPSKAFNVAGIQTSAIVVPNNVLRHKVWRGINNDEIAEPNTFAVDVAVAALTKGGEWLDEMNQYVWENRRFAAQFISEQLSELHLVEAEATYLLWVDCSKVCADSVAFTQYIRRETGLFVSDGAEYGESGRAFVRINIACQRERAQDGLNRLKEGVRKFLQQGSER